MGFKCSFKWCHQSIFSNIFLSQVFLEWRSKTCTEVGKKWSQGMYIFFKNEAKKNSMEQLLDHMIPLSYPSSNIYKFSLKLYHMEHNGSGDFSHANTKEWSVDVAITEALKWKKQHTKLFLNWVWRRFPVQKLFRFKIKYQKETKTYMSKWQSMPESHPLDAASESGFSLWSWFFPRYFTTPAKRSSTGDTSKAEGKPGLEHFPCLPSMVYHINAWFFLLVWFTTSAAFIGEPRWCALGTERRGDSIGRASRVERGE